MRNLIHRKISSSKILDKIKNEWRKLVHQEVSPTQIGEGFSIGFFISFLPLPGFHTLLALLAAYWLRVNKIACLAGLNFHLIVFPIIPAVFWIEYLIGKNVLHIQIVSSSAPKHFDLLHFNLLRFLHQGWPFVGAMFIGAFIIGLPSAFISYWCVKQLAIRWQRERDRQNVSKKNAE